MARKTKNNSRTFSGLNQAAAALGIGVDTLRAAKKAGCLAFRANNCVDEALLKAWLASPENQEKLQASVGYKDKKTFEEWRKLKIRNDKEEGRLVERVHIISGIQRLGPAMDAELQQVLENELPDACSQADVPTCRVYGKRARARLMRKFSELGNLWLPEAPCST